MSFVNENINQVIETKREADADFKKAWDDSREEYRLIGEMISLRKQKNMTQGELAELVGSRQQVISRIEKKENSPSLRSFCNILSALGYELRIVRRGSF